MAMPQRDEKIEAIERLDVLLEYAVMHNKVERWNGGKVERLDTTPSLNHSLPRLNLLKRGQWGHWGQRGQWGRWGQWGRS